MKLFRKEPIKKVAAVVGCALFWLAVWICAAKLTGKAVILPTPLGTLRALLALMQTGEFYLACARSLLRVFLGLIAGIIVGVTAALLSKLSHIANVILSPAIQAVKATPVASVIIVMLFFISRSGVPPIATAMMVIPIIYGNVKSGIEAAPLAELEVARLFGLGAAKQLKYIRLPAALPYFSAGCASALGLAWKAGIAAEVICVPNSSIGSGLYNAKIYLESDSLFAWTAVVILLSFAIEKLLKLILKGKGKRA